MAHGNSHIVQPTKALAEAARLVNGGEAEPRPQIWERPWTLTGLYTKPLAEVSQSR